MSNQNFKNMYELPKNEDYLVDVILPKLQEIQRDTTKDVHLSTMVDVAVDNGMISFFVHLYDRDTDKRPMESKIFSFMSHAEKEVIDREYDKLVSYVRNPLA